MSPLTMFEKDAGQTRHLRHDYIYGRQVTLGASMGFADDTSQTTHTFSYTSGGGSNKLLLVVVDDQYTSAADPTSITYAGAALTKLDGASCGSNNRFSIWYKINPATGTNNLVITTSSNSRVQGVVADFCGVNQTTPLGVDTATAASSASSISTDISSVGTDLIFDGVGSRTVLTFTAGADQVALAATQSTSVCSACASIKLPSITGTTTMAWSCSISSANLEQFTVAIKVA